MSIKGFPSNQKTLNGTGVTNDYATVVPKNPFRNSLDIDFTKYRVGGLKTAEAGTGSDADTQQVWVYDTATAAKVGDVVRFEDGDLAFSEIPIVRIETDRFLLPINNPPASGDTYYILRNVSLQVDSDGVLSVSATPGPTQFVYNGVDTEVEEDDSTPANSRPLPVKVLDGTGAEVDFATEAKQDNEISELQDINTELDAQTVLLTTIESDLDAANASLDNIEASSSSIDTKLTAANTSLDNIEASVASMDTKLSGNLKTLQQNSLVKVAYDQVIVTAVNGSNDPTTVLYKLAGSTVATLTIAYDGSGDFQSVVVS